MSLSLSPGLMVYERLLAPAEPSHLPIDLVRTYPQKKLKARRVAKLQGDSPHLLELLTDSSKPTKAPLLGSASQCALPFGEDARRTRADFTLCSSPFLRCTTSEQLEYCRGDHLAMLLPFHGD